MVPYCEKLSKNNPVSSKKVGVGLYCEKLFLRSIFSKKAQSPYPPFFDENWYIYLSKKTHVCFEHLKMQDFSPKK